jgi:protein TonB
VTVFFVEPAQREFFSSPLSGFLSSYITWKRAIAIALGTVFACLLHCLGFMWYMNHPVPQLITEAKALPMIDIALEAPSAGTPEAKPEPPKPKMQPVREPKPLKKKRTEIKKPVDKEEPKEVTHPSVSTPVKNVTQNNPVVGSKTDSTSKRSESGKISQALAFAGYLNNPKPHYPGIARSRHWEGLVLLRVYVTPDGHCSNLNVARSSGHDVLDESAVSAVRNWRFVPGKRGDTPIASWVTVPIEFSLRD